MFQKPISKRVLAGIQVAGFTNVMENLQKWADINGLSKKTIDCYGRKLADMALHFRKLPEKINEEELRDYLAVLIKRAKGNSISEFKHTVYSMRLYFKMMGLPINVSLPKIKKNKKLPVVLSKQEFKLILDLTKNFKHRLMLMLIYSGGLRMGELLNLKWCDIDVNRMMLHIKQAKGNQDRYVPLSGLLLDDLVRHAQRGYFGEYLFHGGGKNAKMSPKGICFALQEAVKRSGLIKEGICAHTLRHSYATHLLEDGLDIVSIKELLGHSRIESTLVYLHVSNIDKRNKRSPLDTLLEEISEEEKNLHKTVFTELLKNRRVIAKSIEGQLNLFGEDKE